MVKGVSKQVIVVHAPEPKLFEQARFILNESVLEHGGVTDEMLLKEAKRIIRDTALGKKRKRVCGPVWACGGAATVGLLWLLTLFL